MIFDILGRVPAEHEMVMKCLIKVVADNTTFLAYNVHRHPKVRVWQISFVTLWADIGHPGTGVVVE